MSKKNSTWEEAILQVLKEEQKPLKYTQIFDIIDEKGLLATQSATPYNTVNRYLQILCEKKKVVKVGTGIFVLGDFASNFQGSEQIIAATESNDENEEENATTQNPISSFGRFWDRAMWEQNKYNLYGINFIKKINSNKPLSGVSVDFTKNQGIYLLHKGYQIVYVGRAGKGRLGNRLQEHTLDSLRNRWDGFSWFSIDQIEKEENANYVIKQEDLLAALEALLIEVVGSELNMKHGDKFSDKEFEQISESDYFRLMQK